MRFFFAPGCALRRAATRLLASLLAATASWAADAQPDAATAPAPTRPRIGLVLSGGGARGLAHVGVLRVLREQKIPIDVIAATSMGAIVGGAYAAGLSLDEIEQIVQGMDWSDMLSGRAPRENSHWRRKADDGRNLSRLEFGIQDRGLRFPSGAVGGSEIELFLRRLTASVQEVENLRRLPIPFVAMATDLETGEPVELTDVPLSLAMRASMSIPGAFAPVPNEGRLLVDGGLVANLPVEAARRLGADIVIAVNVGTPLASRDRLDSAFQVAQQMINILTEKNVEAAKRELGPNDVLVQPDFGKTTLSDFSKAGQIVALGERTARAALAQLQKFSVDATTYAAFEARRTGRAGDETPVRVTAVRIEGLVRTNPETIVRQLDLPPDRYVTGAEIRARVGEINAEDKFERVDYRLETVGAGRILVVRPVEKSWGPNTLRFGGVASTDFRSENTFNLVAAHTLPDVNRWGGEWRNEIQLGNASMALTDLYQPLGPGSRWFALPRVFVRRSSADVFAGDMVVGRVRSTAIEGSLQVGYTIPRYGQVSLGRVLGRIRADTTIAPEPEPAAYANTNRWVLQGNVDRLDSYAFPRRGYLFAAERDWLDHGSAATPHPHLTAANLLAAWTAGRTTLLVNAFGVRVNARGASTQLGGFLNLSGTPSGRYTGSKTLFVGLIGYREISDWIGEFDMPVYLGASAETGNSSDAEGALQWGQLKRAGAVFLAVDTVAGPVYLGYGQTAGGQSAVYLFWGLFWGGF